MKEDYNPELPPGYEEACEKYPEFKEDSVETIWERLDIWKRHKEGWPDRKSFSPFATREEFMIHMEEDIAEFQAQILSAVVGDDRPYIRRLLKAMEMPNYPEQLIDGVRAAIAAFWDLMVDEMRQTKDQWPNKQEVKQRAKEILQKQGRPIPGERQWARIYHKAGLSALPKAKKKKFT